MMNLSWVVLGVYVAIFVWRTWVAQQSWWLVISVVSWIMLGLLGAYFLPGVLGIAHEQSAFMVPLYVLIGSVTQWRLLRPEAKSSDVYLSLLAASGWIMQLVWLVLLLMVLWQYPRGFSIFSLTSLLQLYVWQPVFWILSQWILMLLIWMNQGEWRDYWKASFLVVLLWFVGYVVADLLNWI